MGGAFRDLTDALRAIDAGTPPEQALAPLVAGYDEHGKHTSEYLLNASLRRSCSMEAWTAAAKHVVEAADVAHLLSESIAARVAPMTDLLLARSPLPKLDGALVAAFEARDVTMMRRLVALGADRSVAAAWVRADLVSPAEVDVSYRAAAEEQQVSLSVTFRVLTDRTDALRQAREAMSHFARLGEAGVLGGRDFDPAASRVVQKELDVQGSSGRELTARLVVAVRGVSPCGLALVLRLLTGRYPAIFPSSVALHGALAPSNDPLSVNSARALSWFSSLEVDALEPWPGSQVQPRTKTTKGFATVTFQQPIGRELHMALLAIDAASVRVLASPEGAGGPAPTTHFDSRWTDGKSDIVLKFVDRDVPVDLRMLRALVTNAALALPGTSGITFKLDAGLSEAAAPGLNAGASATAQAAGARGGTAAKRGKGAEARALGTLPELGDSLVQQLAAHIDDAPWRAVGAARHALPVAPLPHELPPTLVAWLQLNHEWLPLPPDHPLEERSFMALVRERAPALDDALAPVAERLLPGPCLPLFVPSVCADGTLLFLYLALSDKAGESPVLGYDPSDEGLVGVFAPRFDYYLARVLGLHAHPYVFAPGPATTPILAALVAPLTASLRRRVLDPAGVIQLGPLMDAAR